MELQPTLQGRLVTLSPLRAEDFEGLYLAASDPLIWEQHPNHNRYQRDEFKVFFEKAIESKGAFKILESASGKVIGSTRYYNLDEPGKTVMLGFTFLERQFWGKKYNEEAKYLLLTHAFKFVERVIFQVGDGNIRSQKALKKIGAFFMDKVMVEGQPHQLFQIKKTDLGLLKVMIQV